MSVALLVTVALANWWHADDACPDNARLVGTAGIDVGCKRPSGAWHGRRTQWHLCEACPTPQIKVEGAYHRGIEHGHWVWWRRDGHKGLEGDYYAGKKTGQWRSWDATGRVRESEFETYSGEPVAVDGAILRALEEAAAGNAELTRELDAAARDLKKGARRIATATVDSRGHGNTASIGARARMEVATDLPNDDLGTTTFAEGGTTETTPYVRQAIRAATRKVTQCYRRARVGRPRLAGNLVARFVIELDGRATDVRIVESALTETMNQCVKDAVRRISFGAHDGPEPVEVISPWTLKPPTR